jgi:hypothetical protein
VFTPSSLELDIGIAPAAGFGAITPQFRLAFGDAVQLEPTPSSSPDFLMGLGWHHVLHARASIDRGQPWRVEYWLSAARDYTLELACLRHGLPTEYGRGFDRLPPEVTEPLEEALARSLDATELRRALGVVAAALLRETREVDADLAARLEPPFREATAS